MILEIITPILQTGAVGAMLLMAWNRMVKKDEENATIIDAQNKERTEMYDNMKALVKEVTSALVYKNVTDDKMAQALDRLREALPAKGAKGNEATPPTV